MANPCRNPRFCFLLVAIAGALSGAILAYAFRPSGGSIALWTGLGLIAGAVLLTLAWLLVARALSPLASDEAQVARRQTSWAFSAFTILPVLFLPYVVYQTQRQGPQLRYEVTSPAWQALLVALLSAFLVYALLANKFPFLQKGPVRLAAHHPIATLTIMVILWILLACIMDVLKIHNLHEEGMNTPYFVDAMRNAFSQNGPLYSNLSQAHGSSLLGLHMSLVWYLVYPLFMIWPGYISLLSISDIALGLAAIPVYLISRRYFSPGVSILIAGIFLFSRTIFAQPGAGELSEERFLPLLMLWTSFFWLKERYIYFMVFAVLALTVREDVGLVLVLLGVIGLVTRRSIRWWTVPIMLGTIWFVGSVVWMIPHFNPSGISRAAVIYSGLGNNGKEVATTVIFRPWVVIQTMFANVRHFSTWYLLFETFGFGIPLLSGYFLLGLPAVAETLLTPLPTLNHFNSSAIAATLFPAMIIGFATADRLARKYWKISIAAGLVIITLFANLALTYSWFTPARYAPAYNYDAAMKIMGMLPNNASVIMPDYMIVRAPKTQNVQGYYQLSYQNDEQGELDVEQQYVIIDSVPFPESWRSDKTYDGLALLKEKVYSDPRFVKIFEADNLQLFKRTQ
ncbi:MAG: DUF2079 domain-containing protein [Thermoleophilia bacterium]